MSKIKPLISCIIATYNSERTIEKCLESVRSQTVDQKDIEIIVCDGSSTDKTREIVKKYNTTFITILPKYQNAEYNKAVGIQKAQGTYLLFIDHDNILPHKNWLKSMLSPLLSHKSVVGSETLRYHYDPHLSLLDRYFALFGAGDPLAYYLGKADRLSYITGTYNLFGEYTEYDSYYIVKFSPYKIPTLGANGFLIRHDIFKEAQIEPGNFFHIDVNVDLIRKGYNTYAFIKDTIIHLTGYNSIYQFLYRRKLFMEQYYIAPSTSRRYSVYTPDDFWKLLWFIFIAVTLVKPTYDALKGYRKIHDSAWFLHPFLCFTLVFIYGSVITKSSFKKYVQKFV